MDHAKKLRRRAAYLAELGDGSSANLMLSTADEIARLREENEWLKAQLPSSPEAAAAGGGFDPYNP